MLGVMLYNGLRFLVGVGVVYGISRGRGIKLHQGFTRQEWLGGAVCGIFVCFGANFQQLGLRYTTSGKAGFITGLYVVLVPILLALAQFLPLSKLELNHRRLHWTAWAASLLAALGLYLLSAAENLSLEKGDLIVLAGTLFWTLHILAVGFFTRRVNTLRLAFVQYLVIGVLSTSLGLVFEAHTLAGLPAATFSILYVGIFSVGVAYTLQVQAQKQAPEADAAIIMSMEAVFAAFFGWIWLGELLNGRQLLGCALMLGGMLLAQAPSFLKKRDNSLTYS